MARQSSRTCIIALGVTAVMAATLLGVGATAPRPAPAVTLELLDGTTLSLTEYKGSPIILLFWAPW